MTLTGHVKGNTIVLDSAHPELKEGMLVEITPIRPDIKKDPFAGRWQDSRSAAEIAKDIYSSRNYNRLEPKL